jgi:hypothetical protein
MNRWTVGGIAAVALTVASCGSSSQTASPTPHGSSSPLSSGTPVSSSAPTPSPTVTAQPAGPLAACLSTPTGGTPAPWGFAVTEGSELEVLGTSGALLNTASLGSLTAPVTVGVGQAGVYFYDESTGELSILGKSGAAQNLAQISPPGGWSAGNNAVSLAESPNGECWAFSLVSYNASEAATSQIYVGGTGITTGLVDTVTRANSVSGAFAGGYQLLRWDASGLLLGSQPTDVGGGGGPFIDEGYSFATVVRLNPQTATVSAPLCSSGQFADEAADGTTACLTGVHTDTKIVVTKSGASTTTLDTGSAEIGQVAFVGGSSLLTYCTGGPAAGGADFSENLLTVQLGGPAPSTRTLISGSPGGQLEGPWAWFKLAGSSPPSMVEIQSSDLVEVNLSTGQSTTVAPADGILGVL